MVGITAYGAYIPWNRLNRKAVFGAMGWFNPATAAYAKGEKAVAGYDEDSLTMAVAAGMDCLNGARGKELTKGAAGDLSCGETESTGAIAKGVNGLYLASTTLPYQERQNAGIAAAAVGLPDEVRAADFTGSLKAGTSAMLAACEAVQGGDMSGILVCAADCRPGKAGGMQEQVFGDGAVAFLLGKDDVIAELEGSYSLTRDFVDHRRAREDKYDRAWEDRWIRDEGYAKVLPEVIAGLLKKYNLEIRDFAKIIYPCHYDKVHAVIGRKLGAEPGQIQDNMIATVGDTGAAHPMLMLAAALEEAQTGDRLLVAGYGNGADALVFRVTGEIEKFRKGKNSPGTGDYLGVKGYLARRRELTSYEKFAAFHNMIPVETGIRGEDVPSTAFSVLWRDRKTVLGLEGSRCKRCGTPQYPPQRVCVNPDCGATDEMEAYSFAGRKGYIFTYTADNLAYSSEPPAVYGIVEFEGGGRFWFDFADCEVRKIKVGMPVVMSFRRKYLDKARGVHGYFWKAVPVIDMRGER